MWIFSMRTNYLLAMPIFRASHLIYLWAGYPLVYMFVFMYVIMYVKSSQLYICIYLFRSRCFKGSLALFFQQKKNGEGRWGMGDSGGWIQFTTRKLIMLWPDKTETTSLLVSMLHLAAYIQSLSENFNFFSNNLHEIRQNYFY